jgi:hypothetical protein
MLKSVIAAGAVLSVFAPLAASVAAVPLLLGTYLFSSNKLCPMPVTVHYTGSSSVSGPFVNQVVSGSGPNAIKLGAGTLSFAQSASPGTGTANLISTTAFGSPVVMTETGAGITGIDGQPIQSKPESGSAPFSQTATTLTLKTTDGTQNFHIYYGKALSGIAQNVVFIGIDSQGCAEQYSLTRN